MSLTELILRHPERAAVRARLDRFIHPFRGSTPCNQLVPKTSPHHSLVGTAFDYAARMELAHRVPTARTSPWIAELALPLIGKRHRAAATRTVDAARRAAKKWPTEEASRFKKIALHSARLSPLDVVYRAGLPPFDDAAPEIDVGGIAVEVEALLAHASPLWSLSNAHPLHLNPFVCGNLVGGADADIISGNTIVELKTTKDPIVERDHLRQLVGYACLAALAPADIFRPIEKLAVYMPRFGLLREFELTASVEERVETALFLAGTWDGRRRRAAGRAA